MRSLKRSGAQLLWMSSLLAAVWLPPLARAQEGGFGLDLTEETEEKPPPPPKKKRPPQETPAQPPPPPPDSQGGGMELGLDLSGDAVDFRPSLAIGTIGIEEGGDEAAETVARWFEERFLEGAGKSAAFARVMGPDDVRQTLGTAADELPRCDEPTCLEETASSLEVERLVVGRVARQGKGYKLVLYGHVRGAETASAQEIPVENATLNAMKFALRPAFAVVEKLNAKLAQLTVTPNVPEAETRLGARVLGTGERKELVPAGAQTLRVSADGYTPHLQELTLTPGTEEKVEVTLKEAPKVAATSTLPTAPAAPKGPAIFSRPGLYVAVIGVAALGIASAMGASAAGVNSRAVDSNGDGVLDITRAEMLDARRNASAANVLFVAGGLAAVGGGTWLVLSGSF